jgi:hypothetical protein
MGKFHTQKTFIKETIALESAKSEIYATGILHLKIDVNTCGIYL